MDRITLICLHLSWGSFIFKKKLLMTVTHQSMYNFRCIDDVHVSDNKRMSLRETMWEIIGNIFKRHSWDLEKWMVIYLSFYIHVLYMRQNIINNIVQRYKCTKHKKSRKRFFCFCFCSFPAKPSFLLEATVRMKATVL